MYKTYFLDHVVVEAFPTMPEKMKKQTQTGIAGRDGAGYVPTGKY